MFEKTLQDITDYLDFLRQEGFAISISSLDEALEPCLATFILYEFDYDFDLKDEVLPILHNGKQIVRIHITGRENVLASLIKPLKYMFHHLYEQCCEYSEHNTVLDAYRKSLIYIKEHYMEGISVADVAKGIGYSMSYFGYIFKKNRGISANKYITELQLAKAADLLRSTSVSVSAVSERVGFSDPNYFSTVFKAQYGLSPRQYRHAQNGQ